MSHLQWQLHHLIYLYPHKHIVKVVQLMFQRNMDHWI